MVAHDSSDPVPNTIRSSELISYAVRDLFVRNKLAARSIDTYTGKVSGFLLMYA